MNILAGLETCLYVISSALFYPVVAGLVLLIFWIVISFGGFLREYIERKQVGSSAVSRYRRTLESEILNLSTNPPIPPLLKGGEGGLSDIRLERLLQETELGLTKSLDKIRFAIRVGPALGLMGTLIPMGIALSALAQGDMPKMAGSMVTAFTTTVVGLACGVAAYLMSLVKEKWVRADMREMEYLTELLLQNSKLKIQNAKMEVEDEISEEAKTA
jgi:biopolymer transport protein ExbB/TolQ